MTTMTTEQVLNHYGWTIECQSPYEIRHTDGSFTTLRAARLVEAALLDDAIHDGLTEAVAPTSRPRATELEYLTWFRHAADFGPADSDVKEHLNRAFMEETGKNLPEGWNYGSDGETILDE